MSKNCYKCEQEIVLDLDKKDKTSSDYDVEYRYEHAKYAICMDCYDGSNTFTCDCCGNGLAGECVDYDKDHTWFGMREWWCSSCVIDELTGDATVDAEYVGQGHWKIIGESK
jgi:hypothetical protein